MFKTTVYNEQFVDSLPLFDDGDVTVWARVQFDGSHESPVNFYVKVATLISMIMSDSLL
jgi:hypothetical protein